MFAFGRCWKKDGWIISLYQQVDDRYATLKIRKAEAAESGHGTLTDATRGGRGNV